VLPDRLTPGLRAVFIGINPGIRSAQTGHHYAGRGNRFWRLLQESGLIDRPLEAVQDDLLPELGFGLTNLVDRETPGVAELSGTELADGGVGLEAKLARFKPEWAVFVGLTVYRAAFAHRGKLDCGTQPRILGDTRCWVLPNPSGRNTHYTHEAMRLQYAALAERLARPRFVLLTHHSEPVHHDLLLERADCCWTWRLTAPPDQAHEATRIDDHRKHYLTYEGDISGGRGRVERIDRGTYSLREDGCALLDGLAGVIPFRVAL